MEINYYIEIFLGNDFSHLKINASNIELFAQIWVSDDGRAPHTTSHINCSTSP